MSTTKAADVALTYSGKGPGSIFVIDFGIASRGAAINFLSQCAHEGIAQLHRSPSSVRGRHAFRFPHEEEMLFPPMTMLECTGCSERSGKRLVMVRPTVSTMRPDTSGIEEPEDMPRTQLVPPPDSVSGAAQTEPSPSVGASLPVTTSLNTHCIRLSVPLPRLE
jgi:hypothetical protein